LIAVYGGQVRGADGGRGRGRDLVGGDGIIQLTRLLEHIAEVAVCVSKLWTETDCFLIISDGCLELALSFEDT
jgi:hypothetical protein